MHLNLLYVTLLLCLVRIITTFSAPSGNETDRLALIEIKAKLNPTPLKAFESWNDSVHFCQWHGVTCGRKHQRVTILNLKSLQLSGSISPYVGNLSFLRKLRLQNNSLIGGIPPQLGHLRRLQVVILSNNSLTGKISPSISNCSNLYAIFFPNNQLEGLIPIGLGSLTKLQILILGNNHLKGTIPPALGNLSSLQLLQLSKNNLVGDLPASLGELKNLKELGLGQNELSGTVPYSIYNISSLTGLDLGNNNLHGTLSSDIGISLPNIWYLSFSFNNFSGSIPVSISNASNLQKLQVSANSLTGKIPSLEKLVNLLSLTITKNLLGTGQQGDLNFLSSLTNATFLRVVSINVNHFGGTIPKEIGNLSRHLSILTLDNNQLVGGMPMEIGKLINLQRFDAWANELSGFIPDSIGRLWDIKILAIHQNNFSGYIPSAVGNLTKLLILYLSKNKLRGNIPSDLMNCQKLLELDLSGNYLDGSISPNIITRLSSLSIFLGLSDNRLVGDLPEEIGSLKNLGALDVSKNLLSGGIPGALGSCSSLRRLDMQGNGFQGSIPSSLSSLKGLELFDVSFNNMSGEIPNFFDSLRSLESLNLSFNNFEGAVTTEGIFWNVSAISVVGNPRLCGGNPELRLPRCNFQKKKTSPKLEIILPVVLVPLSLSVVVICCLMYRTRRRNRETTTTQDGKELPKLSYQSLFKATNGFSSANLIGSGSFGSVYKGTLDLEGTTIAVKVFDLTKKGASRSFIAECESLKNIRHRNLVKVLTACSSIDHQRNDFKALVYEFMANGSLEEWLHPNQSLHSTPRFLNLVQRLNICIDVACALDYLHHQCGTSIVHCDLKPSNILLDDEMVGHVSDFGLSKFLLDKASQGQTSQSTSIGIRGTVGYAPPEYGMGSAVSMHADIYSYGILLLEIFTGKRPTDDMFRDGSTLHNFVKSALPEQVVKVVDHTILDIKPEEMEEANIKVLLECMVSIFRIGISCSVESPKVRANIGDVVSQLFNVRSTLLSMRLSW